jgi:membrane-bound serine protease (ClpP class)
MDAALDQPAVVLLAVAVGAVLFLLEVALPTVGLAGGAALLLGAVAAWGIQRQSATWWPLVAVVAAMAVWAVLVAARRPSVVGQALAGGLFAAGAVGFGVVNDDVGAAACGVVVAAALPALFPRILGAAQRLLDLPPQVGMEAMVGAGGEVVEWSGGRGRVRVGGTLWNASGPEGLVAGQAVEVRGVSGMTVEVAPAARTLRPHG